MCFRPPSIRALACAGLLTLLLSACNVPRRMPEGMSREAVAARLGRPLRIESHPDGGESWYYHAIRKSREVSWTNNLNRPGESVYDRDLRIDMSDGVLGGGVEFGTSESSAEQALRFDANGRLAHSPPHSFLPRN